MHGIDAESSMLKRPTCVIAKDVKSYTYCCYVRYLSLIVRIGEMPWPILVATQYHAELRLPEEGSAIKRLVVFNIVWLGSIIYWMDL